MEVIERMIEQQMRVIETGLGIKLPRAGGEDNMKIENMQTVPEFFGVNIHDHIWVEGAEAMAEKGGKRR